MSIIETRSCYIIITDEFIGQDVVEEIVKEIGDDFVVVQLEYFLLLIEFIFVQNSLNAKCKLHYFVNDSHS